MTYLSACSSVLAPHTLNSLFAQASFEPVNKHRKLLPASLYPTFSPLLMLNPPPRPPNTGLIYGPVELPGPGRQVISITAGILCNEGSRCKGTAPGPAVLSVNNNNSPPQIHWHLILLGLSVVTGVFSYTLLIKP